MNTFPSPNPSPKRIPAWLLFVIAVLGPPAVFIPFSHIISQNPILIALLVLAYEVIVFLVGFVSKVWQKLGSTLLVDYLMRQAGIRVLAWLWRFFVWLWTTLVVVMIVGLLG